MRLHFRLCDLPKQLRSRYMPADAEQTANALAALEGDVVGLTRRMSSVVSLDFRQTPEQRCRNKYHESENGAEFKLLAVYLRLLAGSSRGFSAFAIEELISSFRKFTYGLWNFTKTSRWYDDLGSLREGPKSENGYNSGVTKAFSKMLVLPLRASGISASLTCRPYILVSNRHPEDCIRGGSFFITPAAVSAYSSDEFDQSTLLNSSVLSAATLSAPREERRRRKADDAPRSKHPRKHWDKDQYRAVAELDGVEWPLKKDWPPAYYDEKEARSMEEKLCGG